MSYECFVIIQLKELMLMRQANQKSVICVTIGAFYIED